MLRRARYILRRQSRLSARLFVTLRYRDHIGWKSSKIILQLVSLGCSLSADPNIKDVFQKKRPKILTQSDPPPVKLSVADIRWQIVAERSVIAQWSQWRAYKKPTTLFPMVRSTTPTTSPSLKNCGLKCTPHDIEFRMAISFSTMGHRIHFMFGSRV